MHFYYCELRILNVLFFLKRSPFWCRLRKGQYFVIQESAALKLSICLYCTHPSWSSTALHRQTYNTAKRVSFNKFTTVIDTRTISRKWLSARRSSPFALGVCAKFRKNKMKINAQTPRHRANATRIKHIHHSQSHHACSGYIKIHANCTSLAHLKQ